MLSGRKPEGCKFMETLYLLRHSGQSRNNVRPLEVVLQHNLVGCQLATKFRKVLCASLNLIQKSST